MKGFYSIIQYCPDSARAEVANVGVVLACPETEFFDFCISEENDVPCRIFGISGTALTRLTQAKDLLKGLLNTKRNHLSKPEELQKFICTLGNDFLMTPMRNLKVQNPQQELGRLYEELVSCKWPLENQNSKKPSLIENSDMLPKTQEKIDTQYLNRVLPGSEEDMIDIETILENRPKFTDVPWRARPGINGIGFRIMDTSGGLVVNCQYRSEAHLIAAAPDIYDVLREAVEACGHPDDLDGWLVRAKMALAKAEGKKVES